MNMADNVMEKVYCCDRPNDNAALLAAVMGNKGSSAETAALMNGMGNQWNNPFVYLVWMMFAQRLWGNNDVNGQNGQNAQNIELQNQIQSLRSQLADNQNSGLLMGAIQGNNSDLKTLSANLNCDFNTLQGAICDVRNGISLLAGKSDSNSEKVINSIVNGNLQMTQSLKDCCCQTQQNITKMGYENQLAVQSQTNTLQQGLNFVNSSVERGFSAIGFQSAQDKCDIIRAAQDNTQKIIDTMNQHWNADLQQKYNDARLELSQQRQNATLIAALGTKTTTTTT